MKKSPQKAAVSDSQNSTAKPPPAPIFVSRNYNYGVHTIVLRAPEFGKATNLLETKIIRIMLHDVVTKDAHSVKVIRRDTIVSGPPGTLDGKLIVDAFLPSGLFIYAAVNLYKNDHTKQTPYPVPVLVP